MATYEKKIEFFFRKIWKVQKNVLPLYQKKETNKNTTIMDTIFTIIFILFIGVVSFIHFIQIIVELWNEVGKDFWKNIKSTIINWFNDTEIGMWYTNKKNKVEIISEWEYKNLLKSGQIKNTIIIVED